MTALFLFICYMCRGIFKHIAIGKRTRLNKWAEIQQRYYQFIPFVC